MLPPFSHWPAKGCQFHKWLTAHISDGNLNYQEVKLNATSTYDKGTMALSPFEIYGFCRGEKSTNKYLKLREHFPFQLHEICLNCMKSVPTAWNLFRVLRWQQNPGTWLDSQVFLYRKHLVFSTRKVCVTTSKSSSTQSQHHHVFCKQRAILEANSARSGT